MDGTSEFFSEQWALKLVRFASTNSALMEFSLKEDSDIVDVELVRYESTFVYFALFFGPLIIVCNVIVTVSSFLMLRVAKDSVGVYMLFCNTSAADIVKCVSLLFGLLEINSINEKYICASHLGMGPTKPPPPTIDPDIIDYKRNIVCYEYIAFLLTPVSFMGNGIVITSALLMLWRRQIPKTTYIGLWNISISHIVLTLVASNSLFYGTVNIDKFQCAKHLGSVISSSLTSMLSICMVAVERYLYIVRGKKYDALLTPCRVGIVLAVLWGIGLGFGLLPSLVEAEKAPGTVVELCEFVRSPLSVVIPAVTLAVLSLMLTPIAYVAIYRHVKRAAEKMAHNGRIPKFKYKSILVVLLSSITFLVCWGPIVVCVVVYKAYCGPNSLKCHSLEMAVISPLACLAFSNTLLNPLIYAWWHPPYNNALKKVICSDRRRARNRNSLLDKSPNNIVTIS